MLGQKQQFLGQMTHKQNINALNCDNEYTNLSTMLLSKLLASTEALKNSRSHVRIYTNDAEIPKCDQHFHIF